MFTPDNVENTQAIKSILDEAITSGVFDQTNPSTGQPFNPDSNRILLADAILSSSNPISTLKYVTHFIQNPPNPYKSLADLHTQVIFFNRVPTKPYVSVAEDNQHSTPVFESNKAMVNVFDSLYKPKYNYAEGTIEIAELTPALRFVRTDDGLARTHFKAALEKGRAAKMEVSYWIELGKIIAPFSKGVDWYIEEVITEIKKFNPDFDITQLGIDKPPLLPPTSASE